MINSSKWKSIEYAEIDRIRLAHTHIPIIIITNDKQYTNNIEYVNHKR